MPWRLNEIPAEAAAVAGANIRTLRQRTGWTQAKLGELMGWSASTVCAAEGRRNRQQRGFIPREIKELAAIFGISPEQLTTRCVNCEGQPRPGFACLTCGAASPEPKRALETQGMGSSNSYLDSPRDRNINVTASYSVTRG